MYNSAQQTMSLSTPERTHLSIRRQADEEPAELSSLYEGVFALTLNGALSVIVTPEFQLSGEVDETLVNSPQEARMLSTLTADYVVTPNDELAGTHQVFHTSETSPISGEEMPPRVTFYVTNAEFATLQIELAEMNENSPWVNPGVDIDEEKYPATATMVAKILHEL